MQENYLNKLEFNKITEILSSFSVTHKAKKLCLNLKPLLDKDKVLKAQSETTEAVALLFRKGMAPITEIENIDEYIFSLRNNNYLSAKALLELAKILQIARNLKEYYFENPLNNSEVLTNYFNNLYTNKRVEEKIFSCIINENTIDDNASEQLSIIRKNVRKTNQTIKSKLQSLLNSKYLQEPIVTIRNNRYVVPVKDEYRTEIKGFLHDTSVSGSTVFIEPLSVFELNNEINMLKNQENIEIEKILQKLSSLFFDITNEIENNYNLISIIDFIFAKAKYSKSINGIEPIISQTKSINLIGAKHPLIDKQKVVPINLSLGNDFSTLVITGPNTGGKTVALKTVGLLCLMGLSGLHIPAKENSTIYVFDNIFADIGDEQSILESLSTFSSHIVNIKNITECATSNSLVLLDELGSGTDPIEGANLAISILEFLSDKNILTISTTHYPEVKNYALVHDKFENASCEFNLETLSPTYKLLIGVPGQSNAFEISRKLGLNETILANAKKMIHSNTIHIEELLKNIYDDKTLIEKEKDKILQQSEEIESLRNELKNNTQELNIRKDEILKKAKQEARDIVIDAKEDANNILREMENSSDSKKLNKLRGKLNDKLNSLKDIDKTYNIQSPLSKNEIVIGLEVFIPSINQTGTVVSLPNKSDKVTIQIGSIKTNFDVSKLTKSNKSVVKEKEIFNNKTQDFTPKNVSTEINVIGLNIEEAIYIIDKFLDDASLARLEYVRIVHGKGTGTLGKGIQKFLKSHPHAKSYRYGTYGEGEMGVTVVEIK